MVPDVSKYVFFFGRLCEEKGVNVLAKAAKELPNIQFIVAGNGTINIEGVNIQRVGFVTGRLLQTLIKNAEFVVSPSVCTETFGLSNGEAIKLGTPVITTNLGAFPEIVVDGVNGRLVEPADALELSRAISNLWMNNECVEELRTNCQDAKLMSVIQYAELYLQLL